MTSRIQWLVVLAACGGRSPDPIVVPPTLLEPANSTVTATVTTTPPPVAPRAGLSPAVVNAVAGIPMFVELKGLSLFTDEKLQAQEMIAQWAIGEGLTVIPPKQTAQVLTRALLGQHVVTGKSCGAPLYEFQVATRWRSELAAKGKLEVSVYCSPDCVMQVAVSIGTQGERGTEFFAAPFDAGKPLLAELAARLPTIRDNGGHERHGHGNNPVKVVGIPRTPSAGDRIDERSSMLVDAKELAAARACLAIDRFAAVHVEYGANGKLARCEHAPDRVGAAAACVCAAIANHTGTPNSREQLGVAPGESMAPAVTKDKLAIFATASAAMVPDASTGLYKAMITDPMIDQWDAPDRDQLSPCFTDATGGPQKLEARAALDFDALGKPTKVDLVPTTGTLSAAQQTCLKAAFMKVRLPCPSVPAARATAELRVTIGNN